MTVNTRLVWAFSEVRARLYIPNNFTYQVIVTVSRMGNCIAPCRQDLRRRRKRRQKVAWKKHRARNPAMMPAFEPNIFTDIWLAGQEFQIAEADIEPETADLRMLIEEGFYACDLPGIPFDPKRIPLYSIRSKVYTLEQIAEEEP